MNPFGQVSDIAALAAVGPLAEPPASKYDALIALGAVIRGETYHFEIVSNESSSGITAVALDSGIPIANGILTTETDAQAEERAAQKGRDCAEVAVETANLLRAIGRAQQ